MVTGLPAVVAAVAPFAVPRSPAAAALVRLGRLAAHVGGTPHGAVWLPEQEEDLAPGLAPLVQRVLAGPAPFSTSELDAADGPAAFLGVPLVVADEVVGVVCAWSPHPHVWSQDQVEGVLLLAATAASELELAALAGEYEATRARYGLSVDAAGIGSFDWDIVSGQLAFDDQLLSLCGLRRGDFEETVQGLWRGVHPDDRGRLVTSIQEAIAGCSTFGVECRMNIPDGTVRWMAVRGQVLAAPDGSAARMLGAVYETTDAHEGAARVARVLDSMSAAFVSVDRNWVVTYVNAQGSQLLGGTSAQVLGRRLQDLDTQATEVGSARQFAAAVRSPDGAAYDSYYPAPVDKWYETRVWPSPDGVSFSVIDVTERRREQQRAEKQSARTALIASVITELSDVRDVEESVIRLAQKLAPGLADWCLVSLNHGERFVEVGWWHAEPGRRELTRRFSTLRLSSLSAEGVVARSSNTREPLTYGPGGLDRMLGTLQPGEARDLLAELAPDSGAFLSLQVRGNVIGALSLYRGADREPFDKADLATAAEIADRAALALDGARMYAQQLQLTEQLQRALLTPPPHPRGVQVAVRYVPAAQEAQVGGDWYDAFVQPDGATVLVIGDVIGHDSAAAAAMGQVRGLLRGIGFTSEAGPAELLSRLDAAILGLEVATTASAVVARLEQPSATEVAGTTWLRWSNAGHPPPVSLTADGQVALLASDPADLLLGIDPHTDRVERLVPLAPGATVLMCTDGLLERRDQSVDEGLSQLQTLMAELADLPLEQLCDELLRRMLPGQAEDDVAVVAVRLASDSDGASLD